MEITTSNALTGISLIGGISHVLIYTNHLWHDAFFMTGILFVVTPLLLRKQLSRKRKVFFKSKKQPAQIETKRSSFKGKCKNCGKGMEDISLGFCSQSCIYENYLLSLSKDPVIRNEPKIVDIPQIVNEPEIAVEQKIEKVFEKVEPEIAVEQKIEKVFEKVEPEIEIESQPQKETPLFIRPRRTL